MIKGYLDNASTTETKFFAKDYYIPGNPNSPTAIGRKAHEALEEAKQRIKDCLGVKGGKVLFCRCASEAVEKLCEAFLGDKACSEYEHDSVLYSCLGCNVSSIGYPEYIDGMKCYDEDDFLYLHQYVNQITGTVFDIESIGKMCRKHGGFFGSDFTAAIGHAKLPKDLESFCDTVWFSGHKLHAEQGIGAIWISDDLVEYLGDRVDYLFEGTPNVSGAVAMSYAMEHAVKHMETKTKKYYKLYQRMATKLVESDIDHMYVNTRETSAGYTYAINAITLPGINADALVQFLSTRGVYISAGHSACSSDNPDASRVLEAFGLTKEEASQTVRISFCEDSTISDIDMLVDGIVEFKEKFM